MHIVTRAFAVLATSATLTLSALPPTQAVTPRATFEQRLGEIAQVETAVPLSESPAVSVREGSVAIETAEDASLALDLPTRAATASEADGRYHLPALGDASLAVTPLATGTQVLIGIDSADAPTTYDFGVRGDVSPREAPDGGVELVGADGSVVAQIEAPWAVDAEGRPVATRYELRGSTIRQVVDHRDRSVAYPVVADPKVKFCSYGTAVCVKFGKTDTARIAKAMNSSIAAGVSTLCGKIPASNAAGLAARAICAVAVNLYFNKLRSAFRKAAKAKKCTEAKFRIIGPPVVTAKVVSC